MGGRGGGGAAGAALKRGLLTDTRTSERRGINRGGGASGVREVNLAGIP